jgi:D-alanine-D-alanine ligase
MGRSLGAHVKGRSERSPIAVVHNEPLEPGDVGSEASRDVLDQVWAVEQSLCRLGHPAMRIPFTRDLGAFARTVEEQGIHWAFNLCETVDEDPRLAGHPAAVMDLLGISYTGSPALGLALGTDKLLSKHLLTAQGIPTPAYAVYDGGASPRLRSLRFPVILKPRFEDASIGIDQDSVVADERALFRKLSEFHDRFGPLILEEFVSGREFNVSLFGYPSPRVMPIAEISFEEFPKELYPIVGYRAKWDKTSMEYHHTPRTFPTDLPEPLRREIRDTAMRCFRCFGLRDYARVDIRVSSGGVAHVLEMNPNPCITPDAGFPAALDEGGIRYDEMVSELLGFAQERGAFQV